MSVATQTEYGQGYRLGVAGEIADSGVYDQISGAAAEAMPNGGAFVVETETDGLYRLPKFNSLTLTLSGDLTSGNFTGTLRTTNLAGTNEDTAISTAFNSDHDTTMDDIIADLNAITDVTATLPESSGTNRVILITVAGDKSLDSLVDFAASGITIAEANSSTDASKIAGISRIDRTKEKNLDGKTTLKAGDDVGVVIFGRVYMDAETAVSKSDTLYTRFSGVADATDYENRGNLRNAAGSAPVLAIALPSGFSVHENASAAGEMAVIEINRKGQ